MLKNQASGTIVLAFLLYVLWQLIDNSFLTTVPLETRHILFIIIGSAFALIVSSLATSEITRQYKRLQELEQLKDDLTDMLVHDLRTPLTSMIGSLKTLQDGGLGVMNPAMSEMVDISTGAAEHLLEMVNDILDISKLESGTMELIIQPVNLKALIDSAAMHLKPLAFDKNIDLRVESISADAQIQCDPDKISRVLTNLIGNAVKYTPCGGSVVIDAVQDQKGTTVRVSDSGPGIPDEFMDKIFEKFGQVESRRSGQMKSTGLGLAFCKLAIEAHQGRIWVSSTPNTGSIFHFLLPMRKCPKE